MPIEMPKGLPFSVDTWSPSSSNKRHHFLTHAHKDHSIGITTYSFHPIYSTQITKSLLLRQFPQLDSSLFVCIQVGETLIIEDSDGNFSVTVFDANHCPGAAMFLFQGSFGNILHTGDCRLTPECLQNLPEKYIGKKGRVPKCQLDYVFLDCTFGNSSIKIPSKYSAIRQVINCIWKHPDAPVVYLLCDLLAQDELLVEVSETFGSKVYVDKVNNAECYQSLTLIAPDILSEDPSSRFQLFEGFYKFYERAEAKIREARAKDQLEPLFIRPSAQWYAFEDDSERLSQGKQTPTGAKKDSFGVWHVCYSSHSSRDELEWALEVIQPKRVVSTTPSCRAMELNYVKKHCLNTRVTQDDPLWKLMDITIEQESVSPRASTCAEVTDVRVRDVSVVSPLKTKGLQLTSVSTTSSSRIELRLNLSPPSTRPPVTLFGRARVAHEDSSFLLDYTNIVEVKESVVQPSKEDKEDEEEEKTVLQDERTFEAEYNESQGKEMQMINNGVPVCIGSTEKEVEIENSRVSSCIGSSTTYSESLRKMYRSMNVPVPRPLPSLTKLMNSRKKVKRSFQF
ncbi:hypothetical protein ACHQM5_016563 [Ranunculus cassubicifolius]